MINNDSNSISLQGKRLLITGASSGIGRAIAVACSYKGATVYYSGRNKERLAQTAGLLSGEEHHSIVCDLTNSDEIEHLVEIIPPVDGVVHCAGIGSRIPCKHLTYDDVNSVMSTNFTGPVLLQSSLLAHKKIQHGASIVFIASMAAWSPSVGNAIYSASKGAIISYANCLALEVATSKIRVNCICPAMVRTEFLDKQMIDEADWSNDEKNYPLKRYGLPEDVAGLAMFLLSDLSVWMTGSSIKISGGCF